MITRSQAPGSLLRPVDALGLGFLGVVLCGTLAALSRGVDGAAQAAATLAVSILGMFGLRLLGGRASKGRSRTLQRIGQTAAGFAPAAMIPVYWCLNPSFDLLSPRLRDPLLIDADQWLFGVQPSVWLERVLSPPFEEYLLICYFLFFWLLGGYALYLFVFRPALFDDWVTHLVSFFVITMTLYLFLPAIGPRFTLASQYAQPLRGVRFGAAIWDTFLRVPFYRDCFPSGHTAGTLCLLAYTWRHTRGVFVVILPIALGTIQATVLCRFHYGIDLLAALAVPFAVFGLAGALQRRQAVAVASPATGPLIAG